MLTLETPRLILRPWPAKDRAPFAIINVDPVVRRYYYPSVLSASESNALIDAANHGLALNGFGFLAVERKADGALIGGAGLSRPGAEVPGEYPIEIGWIFGESYWRQGYATEVSRSWPGHSFESTRLSRIHQRSIRHRVARWRELG